MDKPHPSSKAAVLLGGAALVISLAGAGGPALAGALGRDSDTVDGFHAVKSGTPLKQRAGKLVATSRSTGRLPNNIIKKAPNAQRLGGHPASFFLPATALVAYETQAHATSTYETKAGAAATYETKSGAAATYQTKADAALAAALAADRVLMVGYEPSGLLDAHSASSLDVVVERPAVLRVSWPQTFSVSCTGGATGLAWLTIDGTRMEGSWLRFRANTEQATVLMIGVSGSAVPAGPHVLGFQIACEVGTFAGSIGTGATQAVIELLRPDTQVTVAPPPG